MTKFKTDGYLKSIEYANKGLRIAIKSQRNFRFHLVVAVLVILAAIFLKFNTIEICIIIFAIGFVICAELFNSVIEFALDALYRNKKNTLVGMAKDMSAGAVLIATFTSGIIGAVLFFTHIYDILVQGLFWF